MDKCLFCKGFLPPAVSLKWLLTLKKDRLLPQRVLCRDCFLQLEVVPKKHCGLCSKPQAKTPCADCVQWQRICYQPKNKALFCYNDWMKAYFQKYKFNGDIRLACVFSELLRATIVRYLRNGWSITAVPVSEKRFAQRGFNQVTQWLTVSCWKKTLRRLDGTITTSHKNRTERLQSPPQFAAVGEVEKTKWLVVDDIYTTGVTLKQVSDCLKNAGATKVNSLTLCR